MRLSWIDAHKNLESRIKSKMHKSDSTYLIESNLRILDPTFKILDLPVRQSGYEVKSESARE